MRSHFADASRHSLAVARLGDQARAELRLAQDRDASARTAARRSPDSWADRQTGSAKSRSRAGYRSGASAPGRASAVRRAFASAIQPASRRHSSGLLSRCSMVIAIGRRDVPTRRRSMANSSSTSSKSEITCIQPSPMSRSAPAIAASSASSAFSVGIERAVQRLVVEGARRGETQSARLDPFRREPRHLGAVLLGGGLAIGTALAHDEHAQRGVRHLRRDVHVVAARVERIEEVRESSASSTAGLRSARPRGCPPRPPSASPACRAATACTARSRRRNCRTAWW